MVLLLISFCFNLGHASKFSKFLNKMDEDQKRHEVEQKHREAIEMQQDMSFADFSFRLKDRYVDERGQHCRNYEFRARSNPYKHGYFTVCDER